VFVVDEMDELDEQKLFWEAAKTAKEAGLPLLVYLERAGWEEDDLAMVRDSPEMQARMDMLENLGTSPMMQQGGGEQDEDEE